MIGRSKLLWVGAAILALISICLYVSFVSCDIYTIDPDITVGLIFASGVLSVVLGVSGILVACSKKKVKFENVVKEVNADSDED